MTYFGNTPVLRHIFGVRKRLYERNNKMKDQNEKLRTTIYIDEQLVKRAEILFGEAKVNSFSAFASKAIEEYITRLVVDKNSDLLSDEIRKAIKNEIGPLGSRISKGLYRYAVFLDVLVHIVGWRCRFTNDAIEKLHKDSNRRVAQAKGMVDLGMLFEDAEEEE
jgi:hypothetical protein